MSSPDLGGGCRLCRRPGSLFTGFLLSVLLFSSSIPSSISGIAVSGESDFSFWARRVAPPVLTASSTARAPSHSLLARAGGIFRPADLVLHSYLCSCSAGPDCFRSEVLKPLIFDSNTRSELFSNRSLWFDYVFDRLCSVLCKSEKLVSFLSLLVDRSKRLYFLNSTGVCKLNHSPSRQDKYNLPTPIVLNLYSKFIVDIGALHGLSSVMVEVYHWSSICIRRVALRSDCSYHNCTSQRFRYKLYSPLVLNLVSNLFFVNFGLSLYGSDGVPVSMGFVPVSIDYVYWLKDLLLDRICYRRCTACVIGYVTMDKHTDTISFGLLTGELFVNLPSRTLRSQTVTPASPEIHRRCCSTSAAAGKETTKLGQTVLNLMGHGPSFVLLMGYEPHIVFSYLIVWALVTEHGF